MTINVRSHNVLIDDSDFELISKYTWRLDKDGYMIASEYIGDHKYRQVRMHRLIMGLQRNDGKFVDHKDGNINDNRRCNLRICAASENMRNSKRPKNNKSGVKGVYWQKQMQKWRAYIMVNSKEIHLGFFNDLDKDRIVHDEAAIKYHGEFARLNVLDI
jgi:hypothetical protein